MEQCRLIDGSGGADGKSNTLITFDRQDSAASNVGLPIAKRQAQVNAVDELAGRILPLLAK